MEHSSPTGISTRDLGDDTPNEISGQPPAAPLGSSPAATNFPSAPALVDRCASAHRDDSTRAGRSGWPIAWPRK